MAGRFKVEAVFKAVDKISAPVTRMSNQIGMMTRTTTRRVRRLNSEMNKLGQGSRRVFQGLVIGATAGAFALASTAKVYADFEQSVINASARFQEGIVRGDDTYKKLIARAREVGRTTEYTARQSAVALDILARAGFSSKDAMEGLKPMIDFAKATGLSIDDASLFAVDVMGSFDKLNIAEGKIDGMRRTMDLLIYTANSASVVVSELFEAMKQGAPILMSAGNQSEDTVFAFAKILANAGIKGSVAGTAMKRVGLAMSAPTSEAALYFRKLKVDLVERDTGKMRDMADILTDLNEALEPYRKDEKNLAPIFEGIFGKISLASGIKLTEQIQFFKQFREELKKINGATETQAEFMRDSLLSRFIRLTAAMESVRLATIWDYGMPFEDLVDQASAWLRKNEEEIAEKLGKEIGLIVDKIKWLIDNADIAVKRFETIVFWIKVAATYAVAFTTLAIAIKTVSMALAVANAAMWAFNLSIFANPITWVVLGVLALVGALALLYFYFDEIIATFAKFSDYIIVAGSLVLAWFIGPLGILIGMVALIMSNFEELRPFFRDLWEDISTGPLDDFLSKISLVYNVAKLIDAIRKGELPSSDSNGTPSGPITSGNTQRDSLEVTLRTGENTFAEVTNGRSPSYVSITSSGAFA